MLSGIRVFSSDSVWQQILGDIGAVVAASPDVADVNLDTMNLARPIPVADLRVAIMRAAENEHIIKQILGPDAAPSRGLARLVVLLYKSGGMSADDLKDALGYSRDAATHAIDAAVYQLRKLYGRDFIMNENGVYKIGKL